MDTLDVLRRDPELMVFALVGGIAGFVSLADAILGGIARIVLYVYATEGVKPGQFNDVDVQTRN